MLIIKSYGKLISSAAPALYQTFLDLLVVDKSKLMRDRDNMKMNLTYIFDTRRSISDRLFLIFMYDSGTDVRV
jgi:hypothetical protein